MYAIAVLLALILPTSALAQDVAVLAPQGRFQERLSDRIPVSGRYLVGIFRMQVQGIGDRQGFGPAAIRVPTPEGGTVCIRATSQDGRYESENLFTRSGGSTPWAQVTWPTAHQEFLRNQMLRELAVLVSVGPCTIRPTVLLPVQLGPAGDVLQVLVNSRGAPVIASLATSDHPTRRVRCGRMPAARRLAFDAECRFGEVAPGEYDLRLDMPSIDGSGMETLERVRVSILPRAS